VTRYWGSVVCDNDRSKANVLSWFKPFVPETWGLPLKCDGQEDSETGRETAIRALFRLPDGRLKEAVRKMNARNIVYITRDATPAILKDWREAPNDH